MTDSSKKVIIERLTLSLKMWIIQSESKQSNDSNTNEKQEKVNFNKVYIRMYCDLDKKDLG